jgi:hypothetical protein
MSCILRHRHTLRQLRNILGFGGAVFRITLANFANAHVQYSSAYHNSNALVAHDLTESRISFIFLV